VPVIGAVGVSLSLASGVSALATTAADASVTHGPTQQVLLHEEEISDISLATFHVFDKESQSGKRLACGGCGGCCVFGRAPASTFGNDAYSPLPPRQTGGGHKHGLNWSG
jgi:hypothetical protein